MSANSPSTPKPVTQKRLMNIALYYLGRYETSASRLSAFLSRRVSKDRLKGAEIPDNVDDLIAEVIAKMCKDGYIDDSRYAESIFRRMKQAGKSKRAIVEKLRQAGIGEDVKTALFAAFEESEGDSELEAARRLVKKKRLGPFRNPELRKEFAKKDLGVLARAGFSFDTAVKALETPDSQEDFYED